MSYSLAHMARKTTTMTKAALQKQFGIPGGPGGVPKKQKVKLGPPVPTEEDEEDFSQGADPELAYGPGGSEYVEPPPKKKGAPVISKKGKSIVSGETKIRPQDPKFPGRQTIEPPSDQYTLGRRRAPSSEKTFVDSMEGLKRSSAAAEVFAKRKGKKEKYVAPPIEDIVGDKVNPFTKADVDFAEKKADEALDAYGEAEEKTPITSEAQQREYNAAEDEVEKALIYARGMQQAVSLEMARLQKGLDRIEADQEAMEMCDTSFFDQNQADYYNDYADSLRDEKKKIEDEMDRIQGESMKKRTQAKRATPRTKSRRVVKRRPSTSTSKPRRRKTTSSGRRSPGSPARSR